jgi:hypothetical protein
MVPVGRQGRRTGPPDWAAVRPAATFVEAPAAARSPARAVGGYGASLDEEDTVAEGAASHEELLKGIIGKSTGTTRVVVERGPVSHFADAVGSTSPIYRNLEAAKAAGFRSIPAPPTWPFAMEFSGKFEEMQPEADAAPHPLMSVMGPLMANGGLILHGEQEFIYHRPIEVGDVLVGEGTLTEAYQKESKGKTMTFLVTETKWSDEKTGEPVATARFNLIHRV